MNNLNTDQVQNEPNQQTVSENQVTHTQEASQSTSHFVDVTEEQILNMSDEEYEKLISNTFGSNIPQLQSTEVTNDSTISTDSLFKPQQSNKEASQIAQNTISEPSNTNTKVNPNTGQNELPIANNPQNTDNTQNTSAIETKTDTETQTQQTQEDLAKSFYAAVTAPFKANGQTVKLDNPDDIIRLMQMGLNYNDKMARIKPYMKAIRALNDANVLTEEKINHLIDLSKHNPAAIAQLLKQGEVDTYNLPDLETTPYQASNYMVSDQTLMFEDTVNTLSSYEEGKQVLNTVNTWDNGSLDILYQNPQYLEQMAEQFKSGLFQDTMSIITRDRALGKLPTNVPAVDLYNQVATQLLQQPNSKYSKPSWWNKVQEPQQQTRTPPQTSGQVQTSGYNPNTGQVNPSGQPMQRQVIGDNVQNNVIQNNARNQQKQSASITRGSLNEQNLLSSPTDILNMSDEEFEILSRNIIFKT